MISWAHGTTGIADMCAPSMHLDNPSDMAQLGDSLLLSDANQILADGYLLERTDYEGLGTPGRHAYLVGESEARGVIDIVRAARNLPQLHASNRYVVAGHSEGGEGTLFAMHIADQYAPELHLLGVVAESPPSQLELIAAVLGPQGNYVLLSTAAGFNAAYGDALAPLDQVLTPLGEQFLADVDRVCANALHDETASLDPSTLISTNPSTVPTWDALLQANDAGTFTTPSPEPLLTIHSISDQTVPFVASQLLFGQLCAIGQDETLWLYPGISHFHTPDVSMTDALTWIGHRFDGQPTPDLMTPTAVPGIQTAHCP